VSQLRAFLKRCIAVFRKTRHDAQFDEELQAHFEMLVEENIDRGLPPEEARRLARIALGAPDQVKEAVREQRGLPLIESAIADMRFAFRMFRKAPGFTAVALITLALGIGANTAIFSVVNGILLEPLPYADSSRLVLIGTQRKIHGVSEGRQGISLAQIDDIRSQTTAFERVAVCQGNFGARIRTDLMPDLTNVSEVSGDFFAMLGGHAIIGRPILPEDEADKGKQVAVLSYELWQQDFGGDSNVLSRSLLVEDKPYEIVGVMPKGFTFGFNSFQGKGLWTPLIVNPKYAGRRDYGFYLGLALLKKGVSRNQAAAQLKTLSARLASAYPKTDKNLDLIADSPKEDMVERVRAGLLILLGAVGFVLLIACVNVSSLLVARAWTRQREIAIRKALGATRLRLVRQLLSESAILAILGGALGLLASSWTIRVLRALAPPYTPRIESVRIDANVLLFTLGASLLAAILFGIAPALQASARRIGSGPRDAVGVSLAAGATPRRHVLRGILVSAEVALALILVLGAGLMLRSFEKLVHVPVGFRTDHILTMHANSSDAVCGYKSPEQQCESAKEEILRRIQSLPGVQGAAISQGYAMLGGGYAVTDLYVEGSSENVMAAQAGKLGSSLLYHAITTDYFDVLGMRILEGRKFNDADESDAPAVAIVNQSFAGAFLPANPLGKRFAVSTDKQGNPQWMQVVGIVADNRDTALKSAPGPLFYRPATQYGFSNVSDYVVRTTQDPMALAPAIEKQIWSIDKDAPIQEIQTMDQHIANSAAEPRFQTLLLASFGLIGLVLSIVGVYGVMSYAVVQRTHEIGVRMALGARPSDVLRLIVGEGAKLALAGIAIGLGASWGLSRFLRSLLFEVAPTDPVTFAAVSVLLLIVAIAACYLPARKALRVDPVTAMRCD
jgi:putative ABC transport system permease protein